MQRVRGWMANRCVAEVVDLHLAHYQLTDIVYDMRDLHFDCFGARLPPRPLQIP